MGRRHGVPNLRSQKPITATTQTHQGMSKDRTLIPQHSRPSGVTNVGPTTAIDTHNLAGTIVPKRVAPPLTPAVYQGPDIATVWTCPTPVYTHTARRCANNTQSQCHRAVCALRRPTCPQSNTIGRNQAGCNHSSANTLGPIHHLARTHQTDDKSKGRKRRGYISKGFCANADLCPLASPRVALVGVACSGTPTKAPRGEARGHP